MGRDEVRSVVLDTNALIWLMNGSDRLGVEAKELAESAMAENALYVSAMSFWEVGLLITKNRLILDRPAAAWREIALGQGIEEVPLSGDLAIESTALSGFPNDPADRIIAATAMSISGVLLTADGMILRWDGALDRQDARI